MKIMRRMAITLAVASGGNPVIATLTVILFHLVINFIFAVAEKILFGSRFEHFLDFLLATTMIAFAAYAVHMCAEFNEINRQRELLINMKCNED